MKRFLWATTAALALVGTSALAQQTVGSTQELAAQLQAQGYTSIEIKEGPTQTKVEAVRDGQKLEYVFDRATGRILSQELDRVDDDDLRNGIEFDREDEDWVQAPGAVMEDDDEDDEEDGGDDDDDDDDDRRGRGGDDDDDDDDDHGGRDGDDDDDDDDEDEDDDRGGGGDEGDDD